MSEKSDDSIERFFRKVVVQQDKTFMERDWQSMEKMLDDHALMTRQRGVNSRVVIRGIALSIIVASLFIIGDETQMIGDESQTVPGSVQVQAGVGRGGPRIEVQEKDPTTELHSFSSAAEPSKLEGSSELNLDAKTGFAKQSGLLSTNRTLQPGLPNYAPPTAETNRSQEIDSALDNLQVNELRNSDDTKGPMTEQHFSNALSTIASAAEDHSQTIDSISTVSKTAISASDQQLQEDEPVAATPRLLVTGLISPDFSTTSLTKYSRPSHVFGILLGYKISKRFTLMAGVTKSLKKYEGYGNEYSPPEGYWNNRTNGVVPDEVEGKCGIIEIPLLVQYDVFQRSRSRIFVSGGVSSYFMRSENYQYTFHDANPGAANSWTAKEPTQYLFKIGHLSAGYDRIITNNLSVGIEPFLKLPFQGIGWTDISLYSTGAYINLRYTILRTQQ